MDNPAERTPSAACTCYEAGRNDLCLVHGQTAGDIGSAASTVAALYVEKDGAYFGLPGVDPWDEERDARLYNGPYPVVAHPPCNRWAKPMAFVNQTRYGHKVGDDGGCFERALWAVRTFGGVLEHPAHSAAWDAFELPKPARGGWATGLGDPGCSTMVDQWAYGHPCEKRTWLYYVGPEPPQLDWRIAPEGVLPVVSWLRGAAWHQEHGRKAITRGEASKTPEAFREALLNMARSAQIVALVPSGQLAALDHPGYDGGN